jgi:hypothetical protein
MNLEMLDMYCLNLIYEIEAGRSRDSAGGLADAQARQPRTRRRLLPTISNLVAALRSSFGGAPPLRNLTHQS